MWLLLYRAKRKAKKHLARKNSGRTIMAGKTGLPMQTEQAHIPVGTTLKTLLWLRFAARTKRIAAKEQTSISAVRSKDTKRRKAAQKAPGAFLYDKTKSADWCLF